MNIALPDMSRVPAEVTEAMDALRVQINRQAEASHDQDGRTVRTVLSAYHSTTQSHTTSGNWEAVSFNSEDDLRGFSTIRVPIGMHSKTLRADRFIVPGDRSGPMRYVRIAAHIVFAANATGSRCVRVVLNDDVTTARYMAQYAAATAGVITVIAAHLSVRLSPGETFRIEAYQDSGGALDLGGTTRALANEIEVELL